MFATTIHSCRPRWAALVLLAFTMIIWGYWAPVLAAQYSPSQINAVILPQEFWQTYASEEEALARAEGSVSERFQAVVSLFFLSRQEGSQAAVLAQKASKIINRLYRRHRSDLSLGLLAAVINMNAANYSKRLKDKISYSNQGLANFAFVLPNLPDSLEAKELYLRTSVHLPTFFKNLSAEQLRLAKEFLDAYEQALAGLEQPQERQRLAELKTHVLIVAAQVANRSRTTRDLARKYLREVDTDFFAAMKQQGGKDLVELYQKLQGKLLRTTVSFAPGRP